MKYLFLYFTFLVNMSFSQTTEYVIVDSLMTDISENEKIKNVEQLTNVINENFHKETDKYRALIKWISLNIEYKEVSTLDANSVLKRKQAQCSGYTKLVQESCSLLDIECYIVIGDAKTRASEIGKKLDFNQHSWIAVKLNEIWYLSDPTWVTASKDLNKQKINYYFDENYFLCSSLNFLMTGHYPKEKSFKYGEKISKRKYKNSPLFHEYSLSEDILYSNPNNGIVKNKLEVEIKKNDTLNNNDFAIVFYNGNDWINIHPIIIEEQTILTKLIFELDKVNGKELFFGYKDTYYFSLKKK